MTPGSPPGPRHRHSGTLQAVLEQARSLAQVLGRDDLDARLAHAASRVRRPGVRLMVVGEFKQGKSTLVNGLLGHSICPVDDDVATSVLTYISHSNEPWARAFRAKGADGPAVEEFEPADAPIFVSEAGNPANEKQLVRVEFGLPVPLLESGVILVDTPGVGGLESAHGAITIGALAEADAVVFVTDASQELTKPELEFLRHAHELCPTVIHAISKIDLYPEWRRVLDLSSTHLRTAGLEGIVIGVSSTLYGYASARNDTALAQDSGVPALLEVVRREVAEPGEALVLRAALHDVRMVAAQLAAPLAAERAVLEEPAAAGRIMGEFEAAKEEVAELQSRSAGWQTTLADGVADLNSDIDHDLRARTRAVIQESEAIIDDADPAEMWDEFEARLYARVTAQVVDNFTLLTRRVDELVASVEEHFALAENAVTASFGVKTPQGAIAGLTIESHVDVSRPGFLTQGLTGLRGSYGGVLMFTMLGNLVGLAALNPAILVVGLLMGRRSLRDEKERQLTTRRQQAKSAVRKYIDEVAFQVGKDSRDSLRLTQRELRDHFTARAAELSRSTQQVLQAAQGAAQADETSRRSRLSEIATYAARLASIEERCLLIQAELTPAVPGAAVR